MSIDGIDYEKVQEMHDHAKRMKKIALELVQQLKDEKLDFSDAEMVLRYMHSWMDREKMSRLL